MSVGTNDWEHTFEIFFEKKLAAGIFSWQLSVNQWLLPILIHILHGYHQSTRHWNRIITRAFFAAQQE
jgi:hypothetical protein